MSRIAKIAFLMVTLFVVKVNAQVIVSIPDTMAKKYSTILIPVNVDLKSYDVISYSFELTYDPTVLEAQGATDEGTLTENWPDPAVNINTSGKIIVGAYAVGDTISGKGKLVYLKFLVRGNEGETTELKFVDFSFDNGNLSIYKDNGVFTVGTVSSVITARQNTKPLGIALKPNYPDPFSSITTITYQILNSQHVTIKIVNLLGQEIITLREADQMPAFYHINWDGRDQAGNLVPAGTYFCILNTMLTEKITLIR